MSDIPAGSTVTPIPGGKRVIYPTKAERLVIDAAQYAVPDPRDADLERLTTALLHIRVLASEARTLAAVDPAYVISKIGVLAYDALAGTEPEPASVVVEAMAI